MKREPSIHITKSQFLDILEELGITNLPVNQVFALARKVSINSRNVLVTNKKDTKRVNNILLATKGDAALVADLVYATRVKLRHRGARKITENSKADWTRCKELAAICNQFAQDFSFTDIRDAFLTYITIGFKRMGKDHRNMMTRLISMADNIYTYYENNQCVREDDAPKLTQSIYDYYNKKIADATGIWETEALEENPEKYNDFLQVRKLCEEHKWDYQDYIDAQFEGMAWCNGIPEPHNMYNTKAIDRYKKYVYKYGQRDNTPSLEGGLWNKINNNG